MPWTCERTDLLKTLWHGGLSATAIAERLGGITRNAVIGKVHRLGLAGRKKGARARSRPRGNTSFDKSRRPLRQRPARRSSARAGKRPKARIPPTLTPPPENRITAGTLTAFTCRWPEGDPKHADFHFCGRVKAPAGPYCPHHAAVSAA